MSTTPKYGRRAPKRAAAIPFSRIRTGQIPTHPVPIDHLGATGWEMLGNDRAGDCVAVTWANVRRLVTSVAGAENYPSQDEVWAVYKTQNSDFDPSGDESTNGPGSSADGGMDIQTLLEYLVKHGGPDGVKALAFARVDPTNTEEVKAAIAIFGYVWTGIVVQDANMTQFNTGRPWDYVARSADDGGHSVITGGYGTPGKGALGGDERFITWAQETSFTDRFWSRKVEEAWVVIWPEHLSHPAFLQGVDLNALAADYQAITGKPFPAVIPPQPTPTPTPAPDVTAEQLATSIRGLLTQNGV
ncbi:hypothetical protein SAMN04490357_1054 [Streptomyces misionensis]|uniref:Uncharacterized protein n=1 Tax=Streptomyces misionensis TaxID=67331 RepID=A0A1H4PCU3_9ACTN|nr:hypothetical protein [Streptomyces misionensis]SEC05058.1 hypothetical protein SAMN04490357_1054 [Streptomyces misionensis]